MSTNEPPPEQPSAAPPPPPPPPSYGEPSADYGAPPPTGGYGGPAYPPPPAGPAGAGGYSAGTAWKYGWDKFIANVGQVLIAVLVLFAVNVVLSILGRLVSDSLIVIWVFSLASWVISMIIGAGIVRFALDITEGKQLNPATLLTPHKLGEVIVASLLIGVLTFVGLILCVLPGLAVMYFTAFTLYFLMDRPELGAIDAIKASFDFTKNNAGSVIIWFLLSIATWFVGALLCGIGLIVAIPVVLIGTAYTYKTLNGQPVAA